jgi:hypothetical protein
VILLFGAVIAAGMSVRALAILNPHVQETGEPLANSRSPSPRRSGTRPIRRWRTANRARTGR